MKEYVAGDVPGSVFVPPPPLPPPELLPPQPVRLNPIANMPMLTRNLGQRARGTIKMMAPAKAKEAVKNEGLRLPCERGCGAVEVLETYRPAEALVDCRIGRC